MTDQYDDMVIYLYCNIVLYYYTVVPCCHGAYKFREYMTCWMGQIRNRQKQDDVYDNADQCSIVCDRILINYY